jgi:hypothetical protein
MDFISGVQTGEQIPFVAYPAISLEGCHPLAREFTKPTKQNPAALERKT